MTYDLYLGDRLYSSWSLRGWLMFHAFGIPCTPHFVGLYSGTMAQDLTALAPARLVPAMRMPDGTVVGESLAMAETLAESHPEAALWPGDPSHRATARWLVSEMVSGFSALRTDCPMQLSHVWQGFEPSDAVLTDLDRLQTLWQHARAVSGNRSGWLFPNYSLADVFYTPVAARIVGYDLPVPPEARAYAEKLLSTDLVQSWRKEALTITYNPEPYTLPLDRAPWPI